MCPCASKIRAMLRHQVKRARCVAAFNGVVDRVVDRWNRASLLLILFRRKLPASGERRWREINVTARARDCALPAFLHEQRPGGEGPFAAYSRNRTHRQGHTRQARRRCCSYPMVWPNAGRRCINLRTCERSNPARQADGVVENARGAWTSMARPDSQPNVIELPSGT